MSRLWRCALSLFGFEKQVDFDQVVVAVERSSRDGVDVVDNAAPIFVNDGMVELHHVSVEALVRVSVLWCILHQALWKAVVL